MWNANYKRNVDISGILSPFMDKTGRTRNNHVLAKMFILEIGTLGTCAFCGALTQWPL